VRAVTWQGKRSVITESVPDPVIEEPTDAIVQVTSTAICGSDLHLYELLGMFMEKGDILGHEAMGIVAEVGADVQHIKPGDRVVIPFNISCGNCYMCSRALFAQCETTQVREHDKGAQLFGYTCLYGSVPGAQAEFLRVPQAHFGPIRVREGPTDERYLYLSDILPTAWQAVEYAAIPKGGSLTVFGLGPVGQFCTRIARATGADQVIGVDLVQERLDTAARFGAEVIDAGEVDDVPAMVRELTSGRGTDSVIDAVGMEAHGSPVAEAMQKAAGMLPDPVGASVTQKMGVDRLAALENAISTVRRGGTLSIVGVYAGAVDPMPMMEMFDKGLQVRMGQAHVKRWIDDIMPYLDDDSDPLGTETLATHHLPLDQAHVGYDLFQKKSDGAIKVVLLP
jgi:threonine dehydrogenase-like Zn-dependent dehydrogenase